MLTSKELKTALFAFEVYRLLAKKVFWLKLNYWDFLLVKRLEIEKTQTTFIVSVLKVEYNVCEIKIPTCSNSALHEIRFLVLITTGKKQVIFKSLKLAHPRKGYPTNLKV